MKRESVRPGKEKKGIKTGGTSGPGATAPKASGGLPAAGWEILFKEWLTRAGNVLEKIELPVGQGKTIKGKKLALNAREALKNPLTLGVAGLLLLACILLAVFSIKGGNIAPDFVSRNERARLEAFHQLTLMEPGARKATAMKLVSYLNSPKAEIRWWAMDAIGSIHEDAVDTIPALVKVLRGDKEPGVQEKAGRTIGYVGVNSDLAVKELLKGATDENPSIRNGAISGLLGMGSNAPEVLAALVKALRDDSSDVRINAITALYNIGEKTLLYRKEVVAALRDENESVRANAAGCLGKMKADPGLVFDPLLTALKNDPSKQVKSMAAWALGEMGPAAGHAVPTLRAMLKDDFPSLRANAASALGQIGYSARDTVPDLVKLLDDKEDWIAQRAADALGKIGGPAALAAAQQYKNKHK